ncbi:hypothetical protein PFISCL1PPCAC_4155, partial [Pristionchus fissidentatus]
NMGADREVGELLVKLGHESPGARSVNNVLEVVVRDRGKVVVGKLHEELNVVIVDKIREDGDGFNVVQRYFEGAHIRPEILEADVRAVFVELVYIHSPPSSRRRFDIQWLIFHRLLAKFP